MGETSRRASRRKSIEWWDVAAALRPSYLCSFLSPIRACTDCRACTVLPWLLVQFTVLVAIRSRHYHRRLLTARRIASRRFVLAEVQGLVWTSSRQVSGL